MQKSKTVRMPAGIRNKLMAAVAMLLVSSIMMVSSTYAWFTLSTAPEVTGITTSVGANGNLEIALLNGQTYDDMTKINSAVGDSSAAATQTVTGANITWGNLVDLSDTSYGLNLIALNPAALNSTTTDGKITVGETLLKTAEYGPDGRVSELKDNTISGVYNSTNAKWVTTQTFGADGNTTTLPAYGVRAVGVDSNMTTAQIVYDAAVAAVNSNSRGASTAVSNAVGTNKLTFLTLAMSLGEGSTKASYSDKELAALADVAAGVQTSLNTIVKTYSNAILAKLAVTDGVTDEKMTEVRGLLSGETNASTVNSLLSTADVSNDYTTNLETIATAQSQVATVLGYLTGESAYTSATPADTIKTNVVTPLIGSTVEAYKADGTDAGTPSMENIPATIYVTGGLVATVAAEAGTYEMCSVTELANVTVYASTAANAGDATATGNLAGVVAAVGRLTPPTGTTTEKTIADFYGYILDFAFRTNASGSSLQLQTAAANRVYTDGGTATQGAGSTATFAFDASVLKEEQVRTLLGAIRLVFLDPTTGTVHKNATLTNVVVDGSGATADVTLEGQTEDAAPIVALAQNIPTAVSVLVYLDGNSVDNGDVANAASSGMLNLNLQFSSSAELVPMQNTALQTMKAYTVSFNANGGTGFMQPVKVYGESYTVPENTFTRTGYTFNGWATDANGTTMVTSLTLEEDTTLYAIWTQTEQTPVVEPYTVTFSDQTSAGITFTGNDTTDSANNYTFSLTTTNNGTATNISDDNYTVTYAVGDGTAQTITAGEDGTYTIPAAYVTGNIAITVTAK